VDLGLAPRTALVCASTAGLGLGSARALAAEGARVIVCGRHADRAQKSAAELPGKAVGLGADLSVPGAGTRLGEEALAAAAQVDIVVLNGPGPRPCRAAALDAASAAEAYDILVRPYIELVTTLLPPMRDRDWGRIVAIGSRGVVAPLPNLVTSNMGRSALRAYLKTLASEVARDGVTVNMVVPGRIATDRVASLDAETAKSTGRTVEQVRAASQAEIPAGRYGTPKEFGAVVAFLCGSPASYVTGATVPCDGGAIIGLLCKVCKTLQFIGSGSVHAEEG
jgi:3-oxoacyl-[acyl-carrier protein] reductase